jgi:hypothetical protein
MVQYFMHWDEEGLFLCPSSNKTVHSCEMSGSEGIQEITTLRGN